MGNLRFITKKIKNVLRLKEQFPKKNNESIPILNRIPLKFNSSKKPMVSIIIPFFNEENFTWNCLNYLHKNLSNNYPYEVLLIDDSSTEIYDFSKADGIQLIKNKSNVGFLKSVNNGIINANGDYIYLLNNDTEVREAFLDELFYVFENFDNVGAVGSKLININGTLQEAGAVIKRDLEIQHITGEKRRVYSPDTNYIYRVDYCSGCSLLFKKHTDKGIINLFDEQYAPAYFEETDLCFNLKFIQKKHIYYTGFSEVLHYNGVSYSKSIEHSEKKEKLFNKNKTIFKSKWSKELDAIKSTTIADRLLELYNNKSIVFFSGDIPEFDKDSGSNRLKEIMISFIKLGFKVSFISKNAHWDNHYLETYQKLGILVYYHYKLNVNCESFLEDHLKKATYTWYYGPITFKNYFNKYNSIFKNARSFYDMVDIHHLRYLRAFEQDTSNKSLYRQYLKYKKIEKKASDLTDTLVVISEVEKEYMKSFCNSQKKIITISNIHYPKINKKNVCAFNDRVDILFIGSTHHPNIDAVYWLYNEIMPIVWKEIPTLKVHIIGNINTVIHDITDERIIFEGYVPDIETFFTKTKLMVAPLLVGAGVKGKIGQSFEYYLPVVTTAIGAEGMFLKNEENALIANNSEKFAENIIRLNNDEDIWNTLSNNSEKSLAPFSKKHLINTIEKLTQ